MAPSPKALSGLQCAGSDVVMAVASAMVLGHHITDVTPIIEQAPAI